MSLYVMPYKPEHYMSIYKYAREWTLWGLPNPDQVAQNYMRGPGITGFCDQDVIACGGLVVLWKGVAEAWTVASPLVLKYPLFFHKHAKMFLEDCIEMFHLDRVQCIVDVEFYASQKWVKSMGFKAESVMPKYFMGRTFMRYVIVRE